MQWIAGAGHQVPHPMSAPQQVLLQTVESVAVMLHGRLALSILFISISYDIYLMYFIISALQVSSASERLNKF
jgi:hypothetical protein